MRKSTPSKSPSRPRKRVRRKRTPAAPVPKPASKSQGRPFRLRRCLALLGLALMLYSGASLLYLLTVKPDELPPYIGSLFKVVVLDAGHGGKDRGAAGNGLIEKDLTLDVAERVEKLLEKRGMKVVMTRSDDTYLTLAERVRVGADQLAPAIFVSIHFNYAKNRGARGVETFFFDANKEVPRELLGDGAPEQPLLSDGERLANHIQFALVGELQVPDRGAKNRGYFVLRHARIPAVLIEGGFVTNSTEAARLKEPGYRQRLAEAIQEGLLDYREELRRLHYEAMKAKRS